MSEDRSDGRSGDRTGRGDSQQRQSQPRQRRQQGQPRQRQQGRPRQRQTDSSVTDILSEASGKRFVTYVVGVFAAVALGYGVGLLLLDALEGTEGAVLGGIAFLIPVFGAPIIGMATGLLTGLRLDADRRQAALVSGVGAFAGFLVMLVILVVFAALVLNGNGNDANGDGSLSDIFGPLLGFGAGVGVAGAATTYVVKRISI